MSGWTQEDIDERNRKQTAQGFVEALGDFVDAKEPEKFPEWTGFAIPQRKPRTGRIKGVAAAADRTYNGRVYHSKAEARKAAELDLGVKCGAYKRVTPQQAYPIIINGKLVCNVVVDFEVEYRGGEIIAIEVKGHETDLYRLKAKLLRACYPDLRYVVEKI